MKRGGVGGAALWVGGSRAGPAWVLESEPAESMGKALREGVLRAGKLRARVRHSGALPPLPQPPNSALLHSVLSIRSRNPSAPPNPPAPPPPDRGLPRGPGSGPHSGPRRGFEED